MAEDKSGVIVYANWIKKFEELEDDEAGRLIKHFFRYINDLNPIAPDRTTKLMFIDIEEALKRDLVKWEKTIEEKSKSGIIGNLKRWHIDLYNRYYANKISLDEALKIAESRKTSHSDTSQQNISQTFANIAVNVNDTVNDKVKENIITKEQGDLILSICNFFGYNSIENHTQQSLVFGFVYSLPLKKKLDFVIKEFKAYTELKKLDGYKHSLENFLGKQSEQFIGGKWDDNWTLKLSDYKGKNGISTTTSDKPKLSSREKLRQKQQNA